MTTLPNGATMIDKSQFIVLAKTNHRAALPFVTWSFQGGNLNNTHSGHYFKTYEQAHQDFVERISRGY